MEAMNKKSSDEIVKDDWTLPGNKFAGADHMAFAFDVKKSQTCVTRKHGQMNQQQPGGNPVRRQPEASWNHQSRYFICFHRQLNSTPLPFIQILKCLLSNSLFW